MKVVHLSECGGGVERYLQMLIPRLRNKGIEQVLICSQHFVEDNFSPIINSIYKIHIEQSFSLAKAFRTVLCIRRILLKEKPDILYCHSSFGGTLGRLASIAIPCKIIYNPHGWSFNNEEAGFFKTRIYIWIERILAFRVSKIIAISSFEKQQALTYSICKEDKVIVIKNGLEVDKYLQRKTTNKRKELGIPSDSFVIGMVGRLTSGKSPEIFVKMARLLVDKICNTYFIIVGDGEDKEKIEMLICELNLKDHFLITGWVDNVFDYINVFDIAVLLTKWEGFGLAVAEYMLSKKPLVSTRVGGIPDIVKDGWNGLLINSIDERTAAFAVLSLYKDKELAHKLVENGYNYTIQNLDIQTTTDEHYKLFKDILT